MEFIKKALATLFSTEFLLKLLVITAIFTLLKVIDGSLTINHSVSFWTRDIDVNLQIKKD